MSKRFVIDEELRDKILLVLDHSEFAYGANETAKELRAAPDTVSLGGVEKLIRRTVRRIEPSDWPALQMSTKDLNKVLSDLRRIVAPVQPSAVMVDLALLQLAR